MTLMPASALEPPALTALFNEGFSDYAWPMRLNEAGLRDHVADNDIDLDSSRVAVEDRPAALVLIAQRETVGWIGGTATVPACRRRGLAERALLTALEAVRERGVREVWLEVMERNVPARRLYEKLGFEVVRDLVVWSLPATGRGGAGRRVDPNAAREWIMSHRECRDPWQRSDESMVRRAARGAPLQGLVVERGGEILGAVVFLTDREKVTVLQIAAVDEASAADALRAAGGDLGVRLTNVPPGTTVTGALETLGGRVAVAQHEMRLLL